MLILARTIEQLATNRDTAALLSREGLAALGGLRDELQSEVFEPFFSSSDFDALDDEWRNWIDWFRPLAEDVAERLAPIVTRPERCQAVLRGFDVGMAEAAARIGQSSPALADTFSKAVASGLKSELETLENRERIVATLDMRSELAERRAYAAIGFALAMFLTLEVLDRAPSDRDRIRWVVLKLKRMAAVLRTSTSKILQVLDQPCRASPQA